jgi:hypothetical protein
MSAICPVSDLNLAGMRAVAEGEARRIVDRCVLQARLDLVERQVVRDVGRARDLRERKLAVGAGDREHAVAERNVVGRGFEQVAGDQPALGDDLGRGAIERAAANGDRARPEGAGAVGNEIGIALGDGDFLDRHAKSRRQDLRKGGGVALAMVVSAEGRTHRSVRFDPERSAFIKSRACAERAGKAGRGNA